MKDQNPPEIYPAEEPDDDMHANLSASQLEEIRQKVLGAISEEERGEYTEYVGRAGLRQLAEDIKARGRERLLSGKD